MELKMEFFAKFILKNIETALTHYKCANKLQFIVMRKPNLVYSICQPTSTIHARLHVYTCNSNETVIIKY